MVSRQLDEEAVFHVAREIANAEAREKYLDQICAGDQSLRDRVQELLKVHEQESEFLKSSADPGPTEDQSPISERPGQQIGRYKLLDKIGEGGMGTVFMAEQLRPVKRRVAVKIIKQGMDTQHFVARFEAERQALALMDHPNIARVLDAGCTETGRPYFVMELVKGVPITQFCDENRLTARQRVELFVSVCHAVQHAHQKGIIHRDLKPSNVLVALYDDKPVPKVIDFGVAKATNQQLTERTLFTQVGQIVGTWEYMSPEQAVLNQLDVDTRTDVYALGVILYELLTGVTPLDPKRLRTAALEETLRLIREEDPQKPSNRISSLGETATATAAYRGTDVSSLAKTIRGDMDWIVMKALEKSRSRRYDTANALAADLNRFLDGELIEARPPSTGYRLRKAASRHRVALATTGVVALALLAGIVASTWFAIGEYQARQATDVLSENLRQRNTDLNKALGEWRCELIDRGLEYAFRGELEATLEITEKAKNAGAPREWCLLLEGLACNFSNETHRASVLLRRAFDENPDNLAVIASLVMTRNNGEVWTQSEWERLAALLREATPAGEFEEYERLLLGWSLLYVDSDASMQVIDRAIKSRSRPWPFAQAFLAHAEAHVAIDRGDLQLARKAVVDAAEAELALEDNPLSKSISAWARLVSIKLAAENGDVTLQDFRRECEAIWETLRGYENTVIVPAVMCMLCGLTDDPKYEQAFLNVRDDWWGACRAAYFYRSGKIQTATEPLSNDVEDMPLAAIARFTVLAAQGEDRDAMEGYNTIVRTHSSYFIRSVALQIPLIAGQGNRASNDAREWLEEDAIPNFPFTLARTRLRYYADPSTEQAMLQEVQGSRLGRCYAHFAIAVQHLREDPERAREQLGECLATNLFWCPEYYMAKALLAQCPELHEKHVQPTPKDRAKDHEGPHD